MCCTSTHPVGWCMRCTPAAFDCGQLPNPPNGAVDTSTGTTYKSLAVYTCDEGYELLGEPVRTCGAFAWNGSEPSCISKLELVHRGSARQKCAGITCNTQYGSECFFTASFCLHSKLLSPSLNSCELWATRRYCFWQCTWEHFFVW